jgi:preprotein translocase subunit SecD
VRTREIYSYILIALVTGLALWINSAPNNDFFGLDTSIRRGLDLQGGTQVLLRATDPEVTADEMDTARGVIERRVNGLGVGETVVQLSGNDRIIVELPGVADPEQAVEALRGTGRLEFVDSQGQYLAPGTPVLTSNSPELPASLGITDTSTLGPVLTSITDGADLDTASVQPAVSTGGLTSRPAVSFRFTGNSAAELARFSAANVGQPMCIVLDNVVISCPQLNAALTGGEGVIELNSEEERNALLTQLKYGALPTPLVVETSRTVSATLGEEEVQASTMAGAVGLGVVILFMMLYYRIPGILAALALVIYALISFALYRIVPITLTAAGIAGFVLSIGVAVDANVLIFARLREEYRHRRDFRFAIEAGFQEAWPAIRDSSVATLITSTILYMFGNSFGVSIIKGFALTLGLGVVISLFTAVIITRTFLRSLVSLYKPDQAALYGLDRIDSSAPQPAAATTD